MNVTLLKKFINPDADFEIEIPITWKYSLVDNHVHTSTGFQSQQNDCGQMDVRR